MARRLRGNFKGSRRETSWFEIDGLTTVFTATGGTLLESLTTEEKRRRPFTIVRTHLEVLIRSDQLAADELQVGAIGMAVVSEQASAIGVSAVPTPATDAASDLWFLHQFLMSDFTFVTGTGFDASGGRTYSIDSKVMRKVDDGQDIVIVGELDSAAASDGFQMVIGGRILIKDH